MHVDNPGARRLRRGSSTESRRNAERARTEQEISAIDHSDDSLK
jgi:hypothetical protein